MKEENSGIVLDRERSDQLKKMLNLGSSFYALPLYLLFSLVDWFFYPDYVVEFFAYRLLAASLLILVNRLGQSSKTLHQIQVYASIAMLACSAPINFMIYRVGDAGSPYYGGLILVIVGLANTYRFSWRFYAANLALTVLPFLLLIPAILGQFTNPNYLIGSVFLVSTTLIAIVSRYFHEGLYEQEFESRHQLQNEIEDRNKIIEEKAEEALRLTSLSSQFSPQVVHAIKTGEVKLKDEIHRAEICAIFFDIVNSTQRVVRIDQADVSKVIEMFMEDSIKVLLKHDITVDKFLGDGILAFSNDPIKRDDFVERVLDAAIEINQRIERRQEEYMDIWLNKLEISTGISVGYANVGFYGSDKYFRSYTAIGPVVNLASRLCGVADPSQILISNAVEKKLREKGNHSYNIKDMGRVNLKGFEDDLIKVYEIGYEVTSAKPAHENQTDCPRCSQIMHIDNQSDGIFILKCRSCGYVQGTDSDNIKKKKSA